MNNNAIKVLLIEDNEADARLIYEMLKDIDSKFQLERVDRLKAGFERLDKGQYDVLLLDLNLPDSKGFDTFTKAHEHKAGIPIVILSGLDDEKIAIRAVREGAQDYLMKGEISSRLLSRSISYAIERKNTEKELIKGQDTLANLIIQYTTGVREKDTSKMNELQKKLETELGKMQKLKESQKIETEAIGEGEAMKGSIQLSNEKVPKDLWLRTGSTFKEQHEELFVDEKGIKVNSTEAQELEYLVEIIKELGERGYFAEEHYVVNVKEGAYAK